MKKANHANKQKNSLDRRNFIKASSFLGLGALVAPTNLLANGDGPVDDQGFCTPTTDDILGPYYIAGAPNTTMVAATGEPGDRLFISGTVLSNDCLAPISGALVEVWQANDAAVYSTAQSFELRGAMNSDENGHYAFETIMPGPYLNGAQYRPRHIHYKVSKPGYPTLVTQLYFEGDEFIAADPWASQPDAAERIIPLNQIGGGQQEGIFDIVLDGHVGIKPNRYGDDGYLMPAYPNPSADETSIHFNIFRASKVVVLVSDLNGRELITLVNKDVPQGRFTTQWDGKDAKGNSVAAGTYLTTLIIDGKVILSQRVVRK
ncbi:MAG: T9SS type A sorting domain-containing protein [Flavobacteriales bacterium]|nr:T9SS type A sorting domain-containing protein [Flavobacteriales bacterium]